MEISAKVIQVLVGMVANGDLETYIYQTVNKANVQIDYEKTPAAVFYCLSKWNVNLNLGIVREEASVGLGFVKRQSELDYDGSHNEALVDECKALSMKFLNLLKVGGGVEIMDDEIKCTTLRDKYDANVTGVWIEFNCRDNGGECLANY